MATMLGMNANTNNHYDKNHTSTLASTSTPLWHIFQKESSQCKYWYNGPNQPNNYEENQYLDEAKKFIATNMDLVCFLTDLDGCLSRIRTLMGLSPKDLPTFPRMNVSPVDRQMGAKLQGGEVVKMDTKMTKTDAQTTGGAQSEYTNLSPHDRAMQDPVIRDLVASVNGADIALYDWAVEHYQK